MNCLLYKTLHYSFGHLVFVFPNRFVKRWYRGHNTCSRCDFEYVPVRGQQSQRRLEDKAPKTSHQQHHQQYHSQHQQPVSNKAIAASGSLVKEIKEEKKPDIKREVRVQKKTFRYKNIDKWSFFLLLRILLHYYVIVIWF